MVSGRSCAGDPQRIGRDQDRGLNRPEFERPIGGRRRIGVLTTPTAPRFFALSVYVWAYGVAPGGATGLCDQRHQSTVYNVMNATAVISAGHKNSVTTQRPAETEPAQMAWLAKTRCAPAIACERSG